MQYDPIKKSLGKVFNANPFLRILFYKMLDLLLLRAWHIRKELKRWNKTVPHGAKIMDAGSGFGQYTHFLTTLNNRHEILALDVKEEQIADCNQFFQKIGKSGQAHFEKQDLTTYTQDDSFDLIISIDVMEHILEDEQVFSNFHQSLKDGGLLLISTPSDLGGSDSDHHGEDEVHGFIDEHVRDGYNMDDIKAKLERAGFSRIEAAYTYGKTGSLAWRLSMKYPISILNWSKLFFILLPFYYLVTFPFCLVLNYLDVSTPQASGTGLMVKAYK